VTDPFYHTIILRTLGTGAVILLLCLVLGFVTFSSYRSQHQMAEQMVALAEQLKALADQQRAAPSTPASPADPKPLEITGKVFLGSADKPSPATELLICRVSDGEVARRVTTIDDGTTVLVVHGTVL